MSRKMKSISIFVITFMFISGCGKQSVTMTNNEVAEIQSPIYEDSTVTTEENTTTTETTGLNGNGTGDIYEPTEEDLEIIDEATLAQQEAQEADEQLQPEVVADYTVASMDAQTMYAQSSVNLRQGPSTEYEKIGSLSTNQSVTVTGYVETASGKWYQLSTGEFVSAKYLSTDKVVVQAPSNNNNSSNNNNNSNNNSNSNTGSTQSSSDTEGQTVSGATGDGSGSSRGNRGNSGAGVIDDDTPTGGNLH